MDAGTDRYLSWLYLPRTNAVRQPDQQEQIRVFHGIGLVIPHRAPLTDRFQKFHDLLPLASEAKLRAHRKVSLRSLKAAHSQNQDYCHYSWGLVRGGPFAARHRS